MDKYKELKEMLCEELEHIQSKGELNMQSLEQVDKLAHALKSILAVEAMEDEGYSEHYPMPYYRDSYDSYARGRGRGARRDSMGRYSSERRGSYDDGESMESYRGR